MENEQHSVKFAFVCDGEVAWILGVNPQSEHTISVMESNPVIVRLNEEQNVSIGDAYSNGEFSKQVVEG